MPIPSNLPAHGQKIFERVMTSLKGKTNPRTGKKYTDEQRGKIAWSAVKKVYKKVGERWQKKSFDFYIGNLEFKSVEGKYMFSGHVAAFGKDNVNDVITQGCMDDILQQFNQGIMGFAPRHKGSPDHDVFHEKNPQKIPLSKLASANLDDIGIFINGVYNTDHPEFEKYWNMAQNGFLDGLSIEYEPLEVEYGTKDGKDVRYLKKVRIGGFGHTPRPAHSNCMAESFIKSLDAISFDERPANKKSEGDKLTDEVKQEEKVEEKKVEAPSETEAKPAEEKPAEEKPAEEKPAEATETEEAEKKEEVKSLTAEEVKSIVKEELKSLKPEMKSLTPSEKQEEIKSLSFEQLVAKQLGG